jgi:hypothetical protein
MTDFNIPAGTTQTIAGLSANSTNTVEGNSTAPYGAGGGTLISTGPLPGQCTVTVTGQRQGRSAGVEHLLSAVAGLR